MRKRHFPTPSDGPPSRLAKRSGSDAASGAAAAAAVGPEVPGQAPEDRLIYQQMVESFSVDGGRPGGGGGGAGGGGGPRMWIKAGVVQPGAGEMPSDTRRIYIPQAKYGAAESSRHRQRPSSPPEATPPPTPPTAEKPTKKRPDSVKRKTNLELFKEELKAMQEKREQRKQIIQEQQQQTAEPRRPNSRFEPGAPPPEPPRPPSPIRSELSLDPAEIGASQFEADKDTTNLFLGNLNPELTERELMELFGRFGPLASVKIMWPRTELERSKKRNCGFVAYMCRRDSERAVERLRDRDVMGYQMLMGWGKPVPIPTYPIYVPPLLQATIDPPPVSGLPFNAQPRSWMTGDAAHQRGAKRVPIDTSSLNDSELQDLIADAIVKVTVPADRSLLSTINRVVEHVVREGPLLELLIIQRESENPRYRFLADYSSSEHVYYRWRLYSILHGDTAHKWRLGDFRMYKGGSWWRPPPISVFTSGMTSELIDETGLPPYPGGSRRSPSPTGGDKPYQRHKKRQGSASPERGGAEGDDGGSATASSAKAAASEEQRRKPPPGERPLSGTNRTLLAKTLDNLTLKRLSIAEAMVWCLERAECALEIVDALSAAAAPPDTDAAAAAAATSAEMDRRLAALFLTSDLLHNSAARLPCAAFYRTHFQVQLPRVFARLGAALQLSRHRQSAQAVIRAWSEWALYQPEYLMRLNNAFLGLEAPPPPPSPATAAAAPLADAEKNLLAAPLPGSAPAAASAGDSDLDGQPLLLPGIADYDGDPLDLDGQPLPAPMTASSLQHQQQQLAARSKWAAVDSGGLGGLVTGYDSDEGGSAVSSDN